MQDGALEQELATFEARRDELVSRADGRFVLIYGEEIAGFYDDEHAAIEDGYRRFGYVPLLVKRVARADKPVRFVGMS